MPTIHAGQMQNPISPRARSSCVRSKPSVPEMRSPTITGTIIIAMSLRRGVANAPNAGRSGQSHGAPNARRRRAHSGEKSAPNRLRVELLEIAVNAPLAKRDPPLGGKIGCDARACRHPIMERHDARHLLLEPAHPLGEGIAQAFNNLKER